MYTYEILINSSKLTADDWDSMVRVIMTGTKVGYPVLLQLYFDHSIVTYYLISKVDLSPLNGQLGIFSIKLSSKPVNDYKESKRSLFLLFNSKHSIHQIAEDIKIKKNKTLVRLDLKIVKGFAGIKTSIRLQFRDRLSNSHYSAKVKGFPSHILEVDYGLNTKLNKNASPNYLNIQKSLSLLVSEPYQALFEIDGFPYLPRNYYLPITSFEFDKHSLVVGQSGSGKSKYLELFIKQLKYHPSSDYYKVIVIDPHASLVNEFVSFADKRVVDFRTNSTEVFTSTGDINTATELSFALLLDLMGQKGNSRLERLLRYSLFVLYSANQMNFAHLRRFLDQLDYRKEVLLSVSGILPASVMMFFDTDFFELKSKHFSETIEPIIALVDEMALIPGMNDIGSQSLLQTINSNFLTIFSLSKSSMGDKAVRTIGGTLMGAVFQIAQSNALGKKIILVIDEVSVLQSPTIAAILSEARKFGMSIILAQQYLSQVDQTVRDSIFANVYNYIAFKVSEDDAKLLTGNIAMDIPPEIIAKSKEAQINSDDLQKSFYTDQNTRDCILRLYSRGIFHTAIKAKTINIESKE
jgi:DNA helicase HerA-like ATPase